MHGIVHRSLKQYVLEKAGERNWNTVRERAALEQKLYLPVTYYDDEFDAVVDTLASMSGHDRHAIERDVGYFLAEPLLQTFRGYIRNTWDFLTLLESLEAIAISLHAERPDTNPPTIRCEPLESGGGVRVGYRSSRSYCSVAWGVLEGVADAYDESVVVTEERCTRDGDEECVFHVAFE